MTLYKNCGWWKIFDCVFDFIVKSQFRNTLHVSCAKFVFASVIYITIGSEAEVYEYEIWRLVQEGRNFGLHVISRRKLQ